MIKFKNKFKETSKVVISWKILGTPFIELIKMKWMPNDLVNGWAGIFECSVWNKAF